MYVFIRSCIYTSMHACIHRGIHACIPTYRNTYIQTYRHTDIHTYRHTYIHAASTKSPLGSPLEAAELELRSVVFRSFAVTTTPEPEHTVSG